MTEDGPNHEFNMIAMYPPISHPTNQPTHRPQSRTLPLSVFTPYTRADPSDEMERMGEYTGFVAKMVY